jgi:hypothetical protein
VPEWAEWGIPAGAQSMPVNVGTHTTTVSARLKELAQVMTMRRMPGDGTSRIGTPPNAGLPDSSIASARI